MNVPAHIIFPDGLGLPRRATCTFREGVAPRLTPTHPAPLVPTKRCRLFEVREGRRRNPEPLYCARLGVSSYKQRAFWPFPFRREFGGLSYPVHSLRHAYRAGTSCGGHSRKSMVLPSTPSCNGLGLIQTQATSLQVSLLTRLHDVPPCVLREDICVIPSATERTDRYARMVPVHYPVFRVRTRLKIHVKPFFPRPHPTS